MNIQYEYAKIRVKQWWTSRTPAFRAAVVTGFWSFVGAFLVKAGPWIAAFQDWLAGQQTDFPDVAILGKAGMAASGALVGLVLNYVHRRVKPPSFDAEKQPSVEEVAQS